MALGGLRVGLGIGTAPGIGVGLLRRGFTYVVACLGLTGGRAGGVVVVGTGAGDEVGVFCVKLRLGVFEA